MISLYTSCKQRYVCIRATISDFGDETIFVNGKGGYTNIDATGVCPLSGQCSYVQLNNEKNRQQEIQSLI
jgi:hypothetical protein